jgi:hypothetical protein
MANVYDSALTVATISQQAQTVLANRLAPLRLFTTDFSNEVRYPKSTIQVPVVSATAATSVNPTNFEPGSSVTIGKATVTLDHVVQFFAIDQADLASGKRLENLVKINLDALALKLWSLAITPITTVNFGAAVVTATTITPGSGHLATLWSSVSKSQQKGLVTTSTIYSALIPTLTTSISLDQGAYGFENGVFYANSFTGAVSGLRGFACSKEAIAVASAMPMIAPEVRDRMSVSESVTLDDLGLVVNYNLWPSTGNRALNASFEVMFGAGAAVTTDTMALII